MSKDSNTKNRMEVDYVTKRDGSKEEMSFEKVSKRIKGVS